MALHLWECVTWIELFLHSKKWGIQICVIRGSLCIFNMEPNLDYTIGQSKVKFISQFKGRLVSKVDLSVRAGVVQKWRHTINYPLLHLSRKLHLQRFICCDVINDWPLNSRLDDLHLCYIKGIYRLIAFSSSSKIPSSLVCADFCLNFCFSYTRDSSTSFLLRLTHSFFIITC